MANAEKQKYFENRDSWRSWLQENHLNEDVIWIIYYKKNSGKASINYNEAVEEALCFGWIDGKVQKIDEDRYRQRFSQRRKGSIWSMMNIRRVEEMTSQGKMTEAGLAKAEEAKANGEWEKAIIAEDVSILPPELEKLLSAEAEAKEFFDGLTKMHKKQMIWLVRDAKRKVTKEKRAAEIIALLKDKKTILDRMG